MARSHFFKKHQEVMWFARRSREPLCRERVTIRTVHVRACGGNLPALCGDPDLPRGSGEDLIQVLQTGPRQTPPLYCERPSLVPQWISPGPEGTTRYARYPGDRVPNGIIPGTLKSLGLCRIGNSSSEAKNHQFRAAPLREG